MSLPYSRVKEAAESAQKLSDRLKALYWDLEKFLRHNSALSIDWANGEVVIVPGEDKPGAYIQEDDKGNLDGLPFTRTDIANVIGSFQQVVNGLKNEQPVKGDHLGNLEKIAKADA
jgi:hypothetical protein